MKNDLAILSFLITFFCPAFGADIIRLHDESRLQTKVSSMTSELTSAAHEASPKNLSIKNHSILSIDFDHQNTKPQANHLLILGDGSRVPGSLTRFSKSDLDFTSNFGANFKLKRDQVAQIRLSQNAVGTIFDGLEEVSNWELNKEEEWQHDAKAASLTCTSDQADMAHRFPYPERYKLKLNLKWPERPNLHLILGSHELKYGSVSDAYKIEITQNGLRLYRLQATSNRAIELNSPNALKHQFFTNLKELKLEILIDQRAHRIEIIANDQEAGTYVDLAANPPTGQGFFLRSYTKDLVISELHIEGDASEDLRLKLPKSNKLDQVTTFSDELVSGHIQDIDFSQSPPQLTIPYPDAPEPLKIPFNNIDQITLARQDQKIDIPESDCQIKLSGGGLLAGKLVELKGSTLSFLHPSLGQLTIPKDNVLSISFKRPKSEPNQP